MSTETDSLIVAAQAGAGVAGSASISTTATTTTVEVNPTTSTYGAVALDETGQCVDVERPIDETVVAASGESSPTNSQEAKDANFGIDTSTISSLPLPGTDLQEKLNGKAFHSTEASTAPSSSWSTCDEIESTWTISGAFFAMLGFRCNPLAESDEEVGGRNSAAADRRLSMLSNFSTAYNIISISLALRIMKQIYDISERDESLCSSTLIAGMIVGQLAGGALGDVLGRHRAMAVVMFLQVFAAFGSACAMPATFGNPLSLLSNQHNRNCYFSVYEVLSFLRFILGLGAGGVYPLAATLTAESSQSKQDRAKAVALTFSFQGVGYLVVPLAAWIIVTIFPPPRTNEDGTVDIGASDWSWRILLGLGALPGLILTMHRYRSVQGHKRRMSEIQTIPDLENPAPEGSARLVPVSVLDAIMTEDHLIQKLVGTGGCWLLFDILFYGNTLFQPVVLTAAFGAAETIPNAARDTALIALLALPGYFVSVFAVGKQSPRWIQLQGFFVMGMLYLTIGILFDVLSRQRMALLLVYGSTFFFSNYGPNATTFMLPSMTFSKPCRSTLNGVCAAMGKVGALLGTMVFVSAADRFGQKVVFLACALLSFLGCILTLACVSPEVGMMDPDEASPKAVLSPANPDHRGAHSLPVMLTDEMRFHGNNAVLSMKMVLSQPSLVDYHHSERSFPPL